MSKLDYLTKKYGSGGNLPFKQNKKPPEPVPKISETQEEMK